MNFQKLETTLLKKDTKPIQRSICLILGSMSYNYKFRLLSWNYFQPLLRAYAHTRNSPRNLAYNIERSCVALRPDSTQTLIDLKLRRESDFKYNGTNEITMIPISFAYVFRAIIQRANAQSRRIFKRHLQRRPR